MGLCTSRKTSEGTYDPSTFTIWMGTQSRSGYKNREPKETYKGDKRILVVCTDDGKMTMQNGKIFNTGNHPIETFVPMLHFRDCGFKFDVTTTTGGPVVLEMWAYPNKDQNVKDLHDEVRSMFEAPKKISDITNLDDYVAIFIPGGHGSMLNLPENAALGKLLHIAHESNMPTITLCHGPSALLSTGAEGTGKEFCYKGYKAMCFTDKTDAFTPKVGYLPGLMPWHCQSTLEGKGVEILNTNESGACTVDRELITGDSPKAGNNLGKLAGPLIVKYAVENNL